MYKTLLLILIFLQPLNSWIFQDTGFCIMHKREEISKKLQVTKSKILNSKVNVNLLLITLMLVSSCTNYLFYNSINNYKVISQLKNINDQYSINEINHNLKIGFLLNCIVTLIIVYFFYRYNKSQNDIENEINVIALKNLSL